MHISIINTSFLSMSDLCLIKSLKFLRGLAIFFWHGNNIHPGVEHSSKIKYKRQYWKALLIIWMGCVQPGQQLQVLLPHQVKHIQWNQSHFRISDRFRSLSPFFKLTVKQERTVCFLKPLMIKAQPKRSSCPQGQTLCNPSERMRPLKGLLRKKLCTKSDHVRCEMKNNWRIQKCIVHACILFLFLFICEPSSGIVLGNCSLSSLFWFSLENFFPCYVLRWEVFNPKSFFTLSKLFFLFFPPLYRVFVAQWTSCFCIHLFHVVHFLLVFEQMENLVLSVIVILSPFWL